MFVTFGGQNKQLMPASECWKCAIKHVSTIVGRRKAGLGIVGGKGQNGVGERQRMGGPMEGPGEGDGGRIHHLDQIQTSPWPDRSQSGCLKLHQ